MQLEKLSEFMPDLEGMNKIWRETDRMFNLLRTTVRMHYESKPHNIHADVKEAFEAIGLAIHHVK